MSQEETINYKKYILSENKKNESEQAEGIMKATSNIKPKESELQNDLTLHEFKMKSPMI